MSHQTFSMQVCIRDLEVLGQVIRDKYPELEVSNTTEYRCYSGDRGYSGELNVVNSRRVRRLVDGLTPRIREALKSFEEAELNPDKDHEGGSRYKATSRLTRLFDEQGLTSDVNSLLGKVGSDASCVIRPKDRNIATYDIGVIEGNALEYHLSFDTYGIGQEMSKLLDVEPDSEAWSNRLMQRYNLAAGEKEAKAQIQRGEAYSYEVLEEDTPNARVVLAIAE